MGKYRNPESRSGSRSGNRSGRTKAAALLIVLALAACTADAEPTRSEAADTVTTQQRDSALGASPIPGGKAVGAAREAAAAADAKTARTDSILRDQ
jgi:hypothetical protein